MLALVLVGFFGAHTGLHRPSLPYETPSPR
jgi:hypothetical protein